MEANMLESIVILTLALIIRSNGLKLYNYICERTGRPQRVIKFKGYSVKPLFKDWSFYPFAALFIVYMVLQASVFRGNYGAGNYRDMVKTAYILTAGIMIFKHKIYRPGFAGAVCALVGGFLNTIVVRANGGKMPVYPTFTLITGYLKSVGNLNDGLHVLGTASTKLKFLTDWIDDGWNVMSPGDVLFRLLAVIVLYYAVKSLNEKTVIIN
jgi:hypothetical protein